MGGVVCRTVCVCVDFFFVLGLLLCGSCPLAGLSTLLLQLWRRCISARLMLSQHPTGCAATVCYLRYLSTTLICLCTMLRLNSDLDQTQAIDSCRSISTQPGFFFFLPVLPLRKNPWLCLYIHAWHSPLIGILCEMCSSWIRLLWPQTFGP